MLFPLSVFLELQETSELDSSESGHSLSLVSPEGKEFASDVEVFGRLGLLSEAFSESLELGLLQAKHRIAPSPLSIDCLSLLDS